MELPEWLNNDNVTTVTALGAFAISIYNLVANRVTEKKYAPLLELQKKVSTLEIQEREKALKDEKVAKLKAKFEKTGKSSQLRIINNGKCDARNLRVSVGENSPVINSELETFNTQIASLCAMCSQTFLAATHVGTPQYDTIELNWDDDEKDGKHVALKIKTF